MPSAPPDRTARWRWPAGRAFALIAGVFGCMFLALLFLLAVDQRLVLEASQRVQDKTIPMTLEQFRLARNVEQLRLEGERVLSGATPLARQQALFIISLLASHPAMLTNPRAAPLAREVEAFFARAVREGMSTRNHAEWASLSNRLSLLADDISSEGVNLATDDLRQMSATMRHSRIKLAIVLVLVATFVGIVLFLLHRHLIRPLQVMDAALGALRSGRSVEHFAPAAMLEIGAVEGAIGQLQEAMHENETARQQLVLLATTDGLTGMFNRRHFMALAEEEIERAHRYGRPLHVGMADLDSFKQVNDRYGHAIGDLVLQSVAGIWPGPCGSLTWPVATVAKSSPSCFRKPASRRHTALPNDCACRLPQTRSKWRPKSACRSPSAWAWQMRPVGPWRLPSNRPMLLSTKPRNRAATRW